MTDCSHILSTRTSIQNGTKSSHCRCLDFVSVWGGLGVGLFSFWGGGCFEGDVCVNQRYLLLILKKDSDDILILLNQTAEYFLED